jgi:hypothetical protein
MRELRVAAAILWSVSAVAHGQEIVQVPASKANVVLPDDLFALPPEQWFIAKQVSQGNLPCSPDACEAGFNSGDLVVSIEHAKGYVRIIAGFRGCQGVAFQEIETGSRPDSYTRSRVSSLIKDVIKGAEKSCKLKAPKVPKLDIASLFPKA